ncbi:hypothetical protein C8R44DRAFT_749019 [Mycena epipterygia]|nr:hypothetical protein C8R44DRAFT_749019 [Mycena epipterygia]
MDANPLPKTNMTAEEMVPNTQDPHHDPRFWCLPPIRDDLTAPTRSQRGAALHLVTQGRQVGIWKSWSAAQAMVTGYGGACNHGHATIAECVEEWQELCRLGVHPHPVDPALSHPAAAGLATPSSSPASSPSKRSHKVLRFARWARGVQRPDTDEGGLHDGDVCGWNAGVHFDGRVRRGPGLRRGGNFYLRLKRMKKLPRLAQMKVLTHHARMKKLPRLAQMKTHRTRTKKLPASPSYSPPHPDEDGAPPARTLTPGADDAAAPAPRRIVKCVVEKKARRRRGDAVEKPGKVSWVYGTKLVFFGNRKDKLFILKYGYINDDEDLEADVEDPDEDLANQVVHEKVMDTEGAFRAEYYKKLRDRIGAWYRDQYSSILKDGKTAFADLFKGALNGAPQKPGRPKTIHYYSGKYYHERIKPRFDERMIALTQRAEYTGDKVEAEVKVRAAITQEAWDDESLEFQEEGWQALLADSPTRIPEEMAATLSNTAHFLQPYANVISKRYGMCVAVLLAGPIGKKGGAIGVQSVHAGMTRGVAPAKWPAFDVAGFHQVEKSMIAFAREHFTEADCRARALEGTREAPPPLPAPRPLAPLPARSVMPSATVPPSTVSTLGTTVAPEPTSATGGDASHVTLNAGNRGSRDKFGRRCGRGKRGGGAEGEKEMEINEVWRREDREEWTPKLARAHGTFERGKEWGVEWGKCVTVFFNFEAAWGYTTPGSMMTTVGRSKQIQEWLGRGRKWQSKLEIGLVTAQPRPGSYVALWWAWWQSIQPDEREWTEGKLTNPTEADWSQIEKLHGNNGLMHVMVALLWWGDHIGELETDTEEHAAWLSAVDDVTWVLREILAADVISAPLKSSATSKKRKRMAEAPTESSKRTRQAASAEEAPRRGHSRAAAPAKTAAKAMPKPPRPKPKAIPRGTLRSVRPE